VNSRQSPECEARRMRIHAGPFDRYLPTSEREGVFIAIEFSQWAFPSCCIRKIQTLSRYRCPAHLPRSPVRSEVFPPNIANSAHRDAQHHTTRRDVSLVCGSPRRRRAVLRLRLAASQGTYATGAAHCRSERRASDGCTEIACWCEFRVRYRLAAFETVCVNTERTSAIS
jgi:hypothetical protein